ncbi:MAG: hypothetical protein MI806_03405, partial [Minwuiales bacterium]|nr:hypothetical protein [Minwuiales bacterium]
MHIPTDRDEQPRQGGKLAVLGGCGGIGRALVGAALRRGLDVAVLDLPASLQRYPAPDGILSCPVDASDEAQLDAAFGSLAEAWG